VRSAAAGQIHHISSLVRKDVILARLLPIVQHIITDTSDHTRSSCASVINHLAPLLGKEDTVEYLLPMLLQLLRDESSDVRLNVIANLDAISSVIGVDLLSQSLLPAIVDLAEDSKWRVRFAIIEHIPHIATQLGCQFFNEKLNNLCMTWLGDDIYSIRRAATENLSQLSKQFGEEWTKEHLLPRLDRMHHHTNYLQRMTSLYGVQVLFPSLSSHTIEEGVLPLVLSMAADPVPNVRLTVARTLQEMLKIHGSEMKLGVITGGITPTLVKLCQDSDRDVRFYANKVSLRPPSLPLLLVTLTTTTGIGGGAVGD
jgi:serine/threonine-protein phosphatase 2A regulatory subunit A